MLILKVLQLSLRYQVTILKNPMFQPNVLA